MRWFNLWFWHTPETKRGWVLRILWKLYLHFRPAYRHWKVSRMRKASDEPITLPGFVRDFKNVPDWASKCSVCHQDVRSSDGSVNNASWFVDGFRHDEHRY